MNTSNPTIAERIKVIRGGETLAGFSKTIDCNINTLRSYERGLANPNFDFIQLICTVKNISPEWLIFGRGPMRLGDALQPAENAPEQPVNTLETAGCARCAKLKAELEVERRERRELSAELREVNADNRRLAKENKELSTTCATLMERQKHCCPDPLLRTPPSAPSSEERARV